MKRSLFAPRSSESRSQRPSDSSSLRSPPPPTNQTLNNDLEATLSEGKSEIASGFQTELRGTPGPIRVDEGSVACVIERHLPSSSDQPDMRPSDTRLDTTLLKSSGSVDPQVLEFCAWLERTASLGSASPTAPHVAPLHSPASQNEPQRLQATQEGKCRTTYPASGELPPSHPIAKSSTLRPSLTSSARDAPVAAPFRRYECENYQICLDIAAALDWENFTCSSCNGQVDKRLLWRAKHAQRRDPFAQECCKLPDINGLPDSKTGSSVPDPEPLVLGPTSRTSK
jgi:hypothetical protein